MSPAIPKKFGDWEVIRKEGSGGFGSAYLAKHVKNGYKAIIKQMDPLEGNKLGARDVGYFIREAKILRELDTKYVSKLLDFDFKPAKPWMAIQYFPGTTLWDYLQQGSVAQEAQWFQMAHDILSGLAHAHSKGVVHRDLNPKNIILYYEGARLIDFGLSRFTDDPKSTRIIGFDGFVAPEINDGNPQPPIDIFVAATALSAAGTGNMPWKSTGGNYYTSITHDQPDYKGLTQNQITLLKRMHLKNPAERVTAKEALALVEELSPATAGVQIPQQKKIRPVEPKPIFKEKQSQEAKKSATPKKIAEPKEPNIWAQIVDWINRHKLLTAFGIITGGWGFLPYAILSNWKHTKNLSYKSKNLLTLNYGILFGSFGILSPIVDFYWYKKMKNKLLLWLGILQLLLVVTLFVGGAQTPSGETAPDWVSWIFLAVLFSNLLLIKPIYKVIAATEPAKTHSDEKVKLENSEQPSSDSNVTNAHSSWEEVEKSFEIILDKIGSKRFVIGIEGIHIKGIFLQGYTEPDGAMTVEAAADLSVRPRITLEQRSNLNALGWDSPDDGLPNFIKFLSVEESSAPLVAHLFTKTLKKGYGLNIGTFKVVN